MIPGNVYAECDAHVCHQFCSFVAGICLNFLIVYPEIKGYVLCFMFIFRVSEIMRPWLLFFFIRAIINHICMYVYRDSYGFTLRPQYAQRYREYSLIYKVTIHFASVWVYLTAECWSTLIFQSYIAKFKYISLNKGKNNWIVIF